MCKWRVDECSERVKGVVSLIRGVGVDSVEIARIARSMAKRGFIERLFTTEECEAFGARGLPPETVAGSFAAKEAVSKALGEPLLIKHWRQMSITRVNGNPTVALTGELHAYMTQKQGKRIWVSISHDKTRAVALAIMEG